jgi:NADH:ubiquinone oxidoreductase subunit 4 (subunit M)
MGLFQQSFWSTFFASTSMVLGAVYTLWTYNRIFFGNLKNLFLVSYKDLDRKETYLFLLLTFLLFLMGIFSYLFLDTLLIDTLNLLEHARYGRI